VVKLVPVLREELPAFRALYPEGKKHVVSPPAGPAFERTQDGYKLAVTPPAELRRMINSKGKCECPKFAVGRKYW